MPTTRNRIWTCPRCKGAGTRAPERMRRDDVRRYCLPCSADTGRLVERLCPSLDRERAEKAGRAQERRRKRAERERQAEVDRRSVDGVDLQRELARLCRLPVFGGQKGPLARRPPKLRICRRQKPQRRTLGWGQDGAMLVAAWPGRSGEDAVAWMLWGLTVLYEHRTGPTRPRRALLGDAAHEAWDDLPALRGSTCQDAARALSLALGDAGAVKRDMRSAV